MTRPQPRQPAKPSPLEVQFVPLTSERMDAVLAIERMAYSHPWTQGNFTDAIASGYAAQVLMADHHVLGYFVAMKGVDEVHLLNITVAPAFQRQGWAQTMLEALALWSRGQAAQWLWLEVRESNQRALHVYEQHGFKRVGLRKAYYPALRGERETAIVMSLKL